MCFIHTKHYDTETQCYWDDIKHKKSEQKLRLSIDLFYVTTAVFV